MVNASELIGTHDVLFVTLDTLRYDVAERPARARADAAPRRSAARDGWEKRHTPGSFTYAAHAAFFAGFLPTPACPASTRDCSRCGSPAARRPPRKPRCSTRPDIVAGFRGRGYHTLCVGGVGFFNKLTPLG